jgi:DNA-binding protein H-NS
MSNLIDIQSQIEKLQKQATDIKAREFDKTVEDILAKMQAFGITSKDLDAAKRRGGKGKSKAKAAAPGKRASSNGAAKKSGGTVAAKYRGPNGETWSGRGLMPRWLSALVSQGQAKEEFAIKA